MFLDCLSKAATHVGAVKPDIAFEQGQLANALRNKPRGGWQNKARPVLALKAGSGQKGILRAAAYIHTQHRACAAQKLLYDLVNYHLSGTKKSTCITPQAQVFKTFFKKKLAKHLGLP